MSRCHDGFAVIRDQVSRCLRWLRCRPHPPDPTCPLDLRAGPTRTTRTSRDRSQIERDGVERELRHLGALRHAERERAGERRRRSRFRRTTARCCRPCRRRREHRLGQRAGLERRQHLEVHLDRRELGRVAGLDDAAQRVGAGRAIGEADVGRALTPVTGTRGPCRSAALAAPLQPAAAHTHDARRKIRSGTSQGSYGSRSWPVVRCFVIHDSAPATPDPTVLTAADPGT